MQGYLTGWIAADPVNLLIGVGVGALALAYLLFEAVRGRKRTRLLEAPGPPPEAAIHYEYRDSQDRKWAWLGSVALVALFLFEMWDIRHGGFDLWKLAFIGVPVLGFHLARQRRGFRTSPAVAIYRHGILLDNWRGETTIPWTDIAYVETDPAVSTGYQSDTRLRLLIGRKDGREWRYSERDFGDEAPSRFETIVEAARRHMR